MAVILGSKGGSGGGSGAPSGPAGGDLSGTYPNPTVTNLIPKTVVDAKGDLLVATAADTVTRKAVGATNGMILQAQSGQADGLLWTLGPGAEVDYVAKTSTTSVTATSEGAADTIITGTSLAWDGTTAYMFEFFAPSLAASVTTTTFAVILHDASAAIGTLFDLRASVAGTQQGSVLGRVRIVPAAGTEGIFNSRILLCCRHNYGWRRSGRSRR